MTAPDHEQAERIARRVEEAAGQDRLTGSEELAIAVAYRDLAAQLAERERALRRKAVLDNYGVTFENCKTFEDWLALVLGDEAKITEWFGEPFQSYIQDELDAVDLLAAARSDSEA